MPFKKGEIPKGAKPFKKGQSGNPDGRPKELPDIKQALADVMGDEKEGLTAVKTILMALRAKAVKGDVRAAELLLKRAYGEASQTIDITTQGQKIETVIKWGDREIKV